MSYKTMLVHVDATVASQERVQLAAKLARKHDAKLIGLAARQQGPNLAFHTGIARGSAVAVLQDETAELAADLHAAEAQFASLTTGIGVTTEWRARFEFPSLALAEAATAADLVIIGSNNSPPAESDHPTVNPGYVVLAAGRPTLAVPAGAQAADPRRIVVAFKNTAEARRALVDALPFLQGADDVLVVNIREGRDDSEAFGHSGRFLGSHGVAARTEIVPRGAGTVGARLMEIAAQHNADLIVAGAYGRNRFREWIFGGVTGELLARCQIGCLLTH